MFVFARESISEKVCSPVVYWNCNGPKCLKIDLSVETFVPNFTWEGQLVLIFDGADAVMEDWFVTM